jgi:hypothetical protein
MIRKSVRQSFITLASVGIVAGLFLAATSSLVGAARTWESPRKSPLHVFLLDTGRTVELPVGHQLVVTLPLRSYSDNTWYVSENTGGGALKLIAGPDEKRPKKWKEGDPSLQIFYFQREAPGTTNLVLQQKYWSKPMILKVVD